MSDPANKAVFLSYASQDVDAVQRVAEALREKGIEVWYDRNELVGGDQWDAKIRGQILSCALFVPIISAGTQARGEGYFRLEWKLAVDRSHLMANDKPFLLPVIIDSTPDASARVPAEFRAVQWTRLPGGETPASFCTRVRRLLDEDSLLSPAPAEPAGPAKARAARRGPRRRWYLSAGIAAVAAFAIVLWRPWRAGLRPNRQSVAPVVQSPARELVAKARHLFEDEDDSNRENLLLADDLLSQAEKLDQFDGEVWAAHAQLSGMIVSLGYDQSDARFAELRKQAEWAVKLAPESRESQLANAWSLYVHRSTRLEAEQALKALIKQTPGDWRALLLMGETEVRLGRLDEGIVWFDRAAAISGHAPVAKLDKATILFTSGRLDEAETSINESLAIQPLGRGLMLKLRAQVLWEGDLDGARRTFERMPGSLTLEDRGTFNDFRLWIWRREPEKAIALLNGFTRDFLEDGQFFGPKAELMAEAEKLAGRNDLARGNWELALRLVDDRLQVDPNDDFLLYHRAHCLAELGRSTEAEQALRTLRQAHGAEETMWPGGGMAGLLLMLGHPSDAMDELDYQVAHGNPIFNSRAVLRLNPDFDALRGNARFEAIVARAPGPANPVPVAKK